MAEESGFFKMAKYERNYHVMIRPCIITGVGWIAPKAMVPLKQNTKRNQ